MFSTTATLVLTLALQTASLSPPSDPLPDDKPIQEIFQNLGRDLKHLPSLDTLVIVGTGVVAAGVGHHNDVPLAKWVAKQEPAGYTAIGEVIGGGWTQGSAAIGTYVVGLLAHDRPTIHIGSDLIRAQLLNGVLTRGIKIVSSRDRPSGGPNSMPSGHTSATFASAAVLQDHFGWKVGVPSFAVAGFVGWTRIRDQHHWLTDVLVGASIGIAAGHTVATGHRGRTWALVPVATKQTVALYYVR